MFSSSRCILGADAPKPAVSWPLFTVAQTRAIEALALARIAPHSLIGQAGLALANLTMAYAPHASRFWVASGPGNNGADGLAAAIELKKRGLHVVMTLLATQATTEELTYWVGKGVDAGLAFSPEPPEFFDAAIDALFGIGANRALPVQASTWIRHMNDSHQPVISADVPSGLQADTGFASDGHVRATATLSFLTLKTGLFTAQGRDACGDIWLDELHIPIHGIPEARTIGEPTATIRMHASHKGTYGDVCVVGGAKGMTGATLLAGNAALQSGAGRVFVCFADVDGPKWSEEHPELMFRPIANAPVDCSVVVAGCGGGIAIAQYLPELLHKAPRLVLDADALNQVATSASLRQQLLTRATEATIITPHPLEAARLLGCKAEQVQQDRVHAARQLAEELQCVVVLKGSGTIVAAPGETPSINLTGNARLASAGTGDVLAGYIGSLWVQGRTAIEAGREACYWHGHSADLWPYGKPLTADRLAQSLTIR